MDETGWLKKNPDGPLLNSDLAVQNHHVLWVRDQPRLHSFAYGTDLVQWRGMEVRPAEVMNLWGKLSKKKKKNPVI